MVDGKNFGSPGQKRRKNQTSDLLWIAPLSGRKALHLTFFFAPRSLRLTFGGSHPLAVVVVVGGGGGRLTLLYSICILYDVYVYIGLTHVPIYIYIYISYRDRDFMMSRVLYNIILYYMDIRLQCAAIHPTSLYEKRSVQMSVIFTFS